MKTQSHQINPIDKNQKNKIEEVVTNFVTTLFPQKEAKHPLNDYINTPLNHSKKKKKMVKNKSIDYKGDLSIQNYTKSKPISSSNKQRSLNLSEDRIINNPVKRNYEEVTQTEKEMKLYLKRVEAFTNRINALKKQESELSNRMVIMQKKEKTIEEIHTTKKKLKEVLNKNKTEIDKEKEVKKEQVMIKKLSEQDKLEQYKRDNEQKKRQNIEIAKASQILVKSMINQTTTKNETLNKYKYLQVKEGFAQFKVDEQMKSLEKEDQKNEAYMKKLMNDKEMIQTLREKCDELEKIEEECFEKLKTTKVKSIYFQSTFCLANKIKNETIEHLNNNTIQVNQTATTNMTNSNNNFSNIKPKVQINKKPKKNLDKKKPPKPTQNQVKRGLMPHPNPLVVKMKRNASTVNKQLIKKAIINRPQSSKAHKKENEKIKINNSTTININNNYFTNYKNPTKSMINHKRNNSQITSIIDPQHIKYSTIV